MMAERKPYEFFLLRYVPNAAREEFVNIGLVMTQSGGDGGGFAEVHFTQDWKRAHCLFPDVDVEMLEAIGRDIQNRVANAQELPILLHELMDRYSNVIEISPVRQCLTDDPAKEMKGLAADLVEMSWIRLAADEVKAPRNTGRRWLRSQMKSAFWAEGLEGFVHEGLPVSPYTIDADNFKIDFSYAVHNQVKFFHAVSLVEVGEESRMFPFRVAKIKSKLPMVRTEIPRFTAVVEDKFDDADDDVKMVLAFMKEEEVRVARVGEMPEIAQQARVELGV
jgi:hypothetical protein